MSGHDALAPESGARTREGAGLDELESGEPRDWLCAHVLPTLLHELGNHTQFLTGLRAALGLPGGAKLLHDRAAAFAEVSAHVEDAGWMLAMLASAAGSDMLMARRERRGLGIACRFVDDALRREHRDKARLDPDGTVRWPGLGNDLFSGDGGWQVPFCVASLLLAAGLDQASGPERAGVPGEIGPLEGGGARVVLRGGPRVLKLQPLVSELLPGIGFHTENAHTHLDLPNGWLDFTAAS